MPRTPHLLHGLICCALALSLMHCLPSDATCELNGVEYAAGDTVPGPDCNPCFCQDNGAVACLQDPCPDLVCEPEDCGPAPGMPNGICDDGVTVFGPDGCDAQEDGTCGWTIIQCPEPEEPCAAKACGDTCTQIAACESVCNAEGECVCDTGDPELCGMTDLCADVLCPSTDAYCEDNVAYSATYSECNPESGECVLAPGLPPEDCDLLDATCVDGACDANEPDGCIYNGVSYDVGESFPAGDGCNSCICEAQGLVACTEMVCTPTGCHSGADCGQGQFCDFPGDDCGAWGGEGTCTPSPEMCVAGGIGACGCDGTFMTNDCELQSMGIDAMAYGGCQGFDPSALYGCGDIECNIETEYCSIAMNDAIGPGEPEFYNSCDALPEGCSQGDCTCMPEAINPWDPMCYDGTGTTMMFQPGG